MSGRGIWRGGCWSKLVWGINQRRAQSEVMLINLNNFSVTLFTEYLYEIASIWNNTFFKLITTCKLITSINSNSLDIVTRIIISG